MARPMYKMDPLLMEYRVLKFLMDGRISFKVTIPKEMKAAETSEIRVTPKFFAVRTNDLIRDGLVSGFVPILTERGKARWDALRAIYEGEGP